MISKAIQPIDGSNKPLTTTKPKKLGKILRRTAFGIAYTALTTLAVAKSGWGQLAYNKAMQAIDWVPTPVGARENPKDENGYSYDSFFNNHQTFHDALSSIPNGINPTTLDLNKNKIVLDTQEEVDQLRNEIAKTTRLYKNTSLEKELTAARIKLSELNVINILLWGPDTDSTTFLQNTRPNCQVMGGVQSHFTPDNIQVLKNTIEVTDYNLSSDPTKFFIDTTVHLNGHAVTVPFSDLVKWMSPRYSYPSRTIDQRLAIPILTYALEKVSTDNHEKIFPPTIPSSEQILISGKGYSIVGISPSVLNLFTDEELINVLKKAPQKPILAVSHSDFKDFTELVNEKIYGGNKPFEFLPQSEEKATQFVSSTMTKTEEIFTNTAPKPIKIQRPTTDNFPSNHLFVVQGYDEETQKVLLIDSHGVEYKPLTINEFKEKIGGIVISTEDIPLITGESLRVYSILLSVILFHIYLSKSKRNKIKEDKAMYLHQ